MNVAALERMERMAYNAASSRASECAPGAVVARVLCLQARSVSLSTSMLSNSSSFAPHLDVVAVGPVRARHMHRLRIRLAFQNGFGTRVRHAAR